MQYVRAEAVVDIDASADTTAFTMEAPRAGKLLLNQSWCRIEEAIDNPTSAGVASIEVGGTEYGTVTVVDNDIIGDSYTITEATAVGDDHAVPFSAGDDIECITKTAGTGGTGGGTLRFYLAIEWADV